MQFIDIHKTEEQWTDLIDIKVPLIPTPELLLAPRVPLPLHGLAPRTILNEIDKDWWDRTRIKVYAASSYTCVCCGIEKAKQKGFKKQLDAHELYSIDYTTGTVKLVYIVPLCKYCHNSIHYGRLFAEHEKGNISDNAFYSILSHANTLLSKYNLPKKNWDPCVDDNVCNVPWDKWNLELCINGKIEKFYSKWESKEEQDEFYRTKP